MSIQTSILHTNNKNQKNNIYQKWKACFIRVSLPLITSKNNQNPPNPSTLQSQVITKISATLSPRSISCLVYWKPIEEVFKAIPQWNSNYSGSVKNYPENVLHRGSTDLEEQHCTEMICLAKLQKGLSPAAIEDLNLPNWADKFYLQDSF